jgi:hypothetical protein
MSVMGARSLPGSTLNIATSSTGTTASPYASEPSTPGGAMGGLGGGGALGGGGLGGGALGGGALGQPLGEDDELNLSLATDGTKVALLIQAQGVNEQVTAR